MRLSTYLKISLLTGAVMTPAMAQDAENAQQEALKRLREFTVSEAPAGRPGVPTASIGPINSPGQSSPSANVAYPGGPVSTQNIDQAKQRLRSTDISASGGASLRNQRSNARPSLEANRENEAAVAQSRNERELRLQQQAQEAELTRQQKLSEKRRNWEVDIAERERLRQRQRDFDESVAKELGGRNVSASQTSTTLNTTGTATRSGSPSVIGVDSDKHGTFEPEYIQQLQARAKRLAAETSVGSANTASPTITAPSAAPTTETISAATTITPAAAPGTDEAAIETRALEIVRQNQAAAANTTSPQNSASSATVTAAPSAEESIRRAQALLRSNLGSTTQAAPAPVSRDPNTRGMEVLRQQAGRSAEPGAVTTVRPTLDPATKQIIQKQDRQIGTEISVTRSSTASKTIGIETPSTPATAGELEAQAKETLRQQQEATAATASQPAATPSEVAPAAITVVPSTPPPGSTPANGVVTIAPGNEAAFSPEVEARARQILRERAAEVEQNAQNAATSGSTTTPVAPASGSRTNTAATPQTSSEVSGAQAQALQVLRSHQPTSNAIGTVQAPKGNESSTSPATGTTATPAPAQLQTGTSGLRSKQQRLADLTRAYMADQMTPAEYHAERAKILAEPGPR